MPASRVESLVPCMIRSGLEPTIILFDDATLPHWPALWRCNQPLVVIDVSFFGHSSDSVTLLKRRWLGL